MLDADERCRHLYVVGQTGTGKSTLLLNLIAQDLAAGAGLALLDPHGDLAEAVLMHVPKARTNDLVYINPADAERPIGFNPLSAVPEDLKPIVADGVVSAFRHVWPDSWGPRLDYILTNAVRVLLLGLAHLDRVLCCGRSSAATDRIRDVFSRLVSSTVLGCGLAAGDR